jgi:ABC-type lipoprotein export system ATPase subunit
MTERKVGDERVKAFLDLFDGDDERAAAALRMYKARHLAKKVIRDTPVVVSFVDVKKTYKMGKQTVEALRGASFEIHEGEFVAITGASGSGKSTLLQLIGALDQPTAGVVTVAGKNLRKIRDGKLAQFRANTIGFVFQFFFLQPFLRLEKNLEVPGMFARVRPAERKHRLDELARKVGLSDRLRHYPKELSGGQMQRAAIARALMNSPKLLLADEPTGNLDSVNGTAIIDLFESIREELGTTVVVVTHDMGIAARADRVITMKDGEVLA